MFKKQPHTHLISGPMFSGKSDELIYTYWGFLKKDNDFGKSSLVLKSTIDTRSNDITSRSNKTLKAIKITTFADVKPLLNEKIKYIFIDEIQFFDLNFLKEILKLNKIGISIYLAGLDTDFTKTEFPTYSFLKNKVEFLVKTTARCHICGDIAKYSKRIVEEKNVVLVDTNNNYIASCWKCHK